MRGEVMLHTIVMLILGLMGLSIIVNFGGYVVSFADIISLVVAVYVLTLFASQVFYAKESYYDKEDWDTQLFRFIEESPWVIIFRVAFILIAILMGISVWGLGVLVDSVFIYILVVWGYVIIISTITIVDMYLKYNRH